MDITSRTHLPFTGWTRTTVEVNKSKFNKSEIVIKLQSKNGYILSEFSRQAAINLANEIVDALESKE